MTSIPTPTPTPVAVPTTDQEGQADMALIIGASVGGAIGAFLLVSIVTIAIVVLVWCKVTKKRSMEKAPTDRTSEEEELDDGLYDVIQDVDMGTREEGSNKSLTSKQDISEMVDNTAYIGAGALAATNRHDHPPMENESLMFNSAYIATTNGAELTPMEDAASTQEEEVDEYIEMAPLEERASTEEDDHEGDEYDYVRNI